MELHIPEILFSFNTAAGIVTVVSAIGLIWIGAARMTTGRSERYATAGILLVMLIGWYALAAFLGRANVYWAGNNPVVPTILFGILIPIVVGFYGLTRNARFARLVEAVPLSALAAVQVYRVLGAIFLVLWADGQLPWQFALPAGIGDVATGVLAVVVAGMLAAGAAGANQAAYAWCIFGIADLVVAVTTGALTSPGTACAYGSCSVPGVASPRLMRSHCMTSAAYNRIDSQVVAGKKSPASARAFPDDGARDMLARPANAA
jgi:hypothetical protein